MMPVAHSAQAMSVEDTYTPIDSVRTGKSSLSLNGNENVMSIKSRNILTDRDLRLNI